MTSSFDFHAMGPRALTFASLARYASMPKKEAPKASTVEKPVRSAKPANVPATTAPRRSVRNLDFSHLGALSQDEISRMQAAIRLSK